MHSSFDLHHGDCLDILRTLPDNSIDAVVTDPPYGLSFMGKRWDYDVPSEDIWRECLRVLKPGGHLLAFAGTRTQHRMAVRIEDAGFEIRDMIAWVYGSGFPKSLDVSKAIDKGYGENLARQLSFTAWMRSTGITAQQINDATDSFMGSHYLTDKTQPAIATADMFDKLRPYLPEVPEYIERLVCERTGLEWTAYKQREVLGTGVSGTTAIWSKEGGMGNFDITAPATDAAKQWHGWGTALKPALEPITVARKPLIGTVAENVLTWGTGGVNVDGCRVDADWENDPSKRGFGYGVMKQGERQKYADRASGEWGMKDETQWTPTTGRWPANLIHDGSEEVVGLFPESKSGIAVRRNSGGCTFGSDTPKPQMDDIGYGDSGSAARFFYCAKASKRDRDEGTERNGHPTVKPTALMRYLCRLVTPPGGIVLDPFCGSGSTGKGAILEGFRFVGIEREAEYIDIARARIQHAVEQISTQPALDL